MARPCGSARLGAGHHQAVETAVPQFGNIAVSRRGFLQAAIAARNVRQRVEPQAHDDIVGRRPYELDELAFRQSSLLQRSPQTRENLPCSIARKTTRLDAWPP
jgi:hypothetical protein